MAQPTWDDLRGKIDAEAAAVAQYASEPKQIAAMHVKYGVYGDGTTCGDCVHLRKYRQAATWFKCEIAVYHDILTDWRCKFDACGRFEKREGEIEAIYCG